MELWNGTKIGTPPFALGPSAQDDYLLYNNPESLIEHKSPASSSS